MAAHLGVLDKSLTDGLEGWPWVSQVPIRTYGTEPVVRCGVEVRMQKPRARVSFFFRFLHKLQGLRLGAVWGNCSLTPDPREAAVSHTCFGLRVLK